MPGAQAVLGHYKSAYNFLKEYQKRNKLGLNGKWKMPDCDCREGRPVAMVCVVEVSYRDTSERLSVIPVVPKSTHNVTKSGNDNWFGGKIIKHGERWEKMMRNMAKLGWRHAIKQCKNHNHNHKIIARFAQFIDLANMVPGEITQSDAFRLRNTGVKVLRLDNLFQGLKKLKSVPIVHLIRAFSYKFRWLITSIVIKKDYKCWNYSYL